MHGPTVDILRSAWEGCSLCGAAEPDAPIARAMLTCIRGASDNANVCSPDLESTAVLSLAARVAVRDLARRHGLDAIRWWPPNEGDFLVEGLPYSVRQLRGELEQALGCKVAIYLADCLAAETRNRLQSETVDLLSLDSG
jgi:hypothetical protein